jgi:hypothetical protein
MIASTRKEMSRSALLAFNRMQAREREAFGESLYFYCRENLLNALESDNPNPSKGEDKDGDFKTDNIDFISTEDYDKELFNDEPIFS